MHGDGAQRVMEGSFPRRSVGVSLLGSRLTTKVGKRPPCKNSHDFARARRGAACAACKSVTDVRLVTVKTVVHQMGNTEIAMMHRCSIAVLPGIVPSAEDGLHTSHDDA